MERKTTVFITLGSIVLLIAGMYLFTDWFSKTTGYVLGEDQKIAFARCLADEGAAFYEEDNCYECEKQREILGTSASEIIPVIKCSSDSCAGLREIPAWQVNGAFHYGTFTFEELDEFSECNVR